MFDLFERRRVILLLCWWFAKHILLCLRLLRTLVLFLSPSLLELEVPEVILEFFSIGVLLSSQERVIRVLLIILAQLLKEIVHVSGLRLPYQFVQELKRLVVSRLVYWWLTLIDEPAIATTCCSSNRNVIEMSRTVSFVLLFVRIRLLHPKDVGSGVRATINIYRLRVRKVAQAKIVLAVLVIREETVGLVEIWLFTIQLR
jgi:hypothetical protein